MATMIRDIGDRMVQALDDLKNGKITHKKWPDGTESWYDYDARGNRRHTKWPDGTESWYDYDDEGNCTHETCSDGTEYDYDARGKITHTKWSDGTERWYDEKGNITQIKAVDFHCGREEK